MRSAAGRVLALTALFLVLPVGAASAAYDSLASGQGVISLAPSFRSLLKQEGIVLSGRKGAKVKRQRSAVLPVSGGEADPILAKGSYELGGELVLARGRKSLSFKFVTVNSKPSPLFAKIGGGQQKVAKAESASFLRRGFAYGYRAEGLRLSSKTATRLDKRLDTGAFEPGQLLGSLEVSANPAAVAVLPQGRATLTLDPAFAAKLSSVFVSRNPVFPAEHQGDTFTLPIAPEGQLAPDASAGALRTAGALELLQLGGGQLFWRELWFQPDQRQVVAEAELDPSPPYPGQQGQVGIFVLGEGRVTRNSKARTIDVAEAPLNLTGLTAQNLNEAFTSPSGQGDLFAPGEAAGTISFTAQGQ
jgi:hypothetical protein